MLPTTYNPLLKGGLNSMNNYPFDAMPCTNARRWTRTTATQIQSLLPYQLGYISLIGESRLYPNSEDLSRLATIWFYILELLYIARFKDRVRFELTDALSDASGFQDRCNKPLCHLSKRRASHWQKMGRRCQKPDTSSRN